MNLLELENRVRSDLGEEDKDGFFSSQDIRDWINQGQMDIANRALHLQTRKCAGDIEGKEIELPENFLKVYRLYVGGVEVKSHLSEADFTYARWGNSLLLDFELNNNNIMLYYYKKPEIMQEDEDDPEVPAEYHSILVDYTLHKAKAKDEDMRASNSYFEKYMIGLQKMKKEYGIQRKRKTIKVMR